VFYKEKVRFQFIPNPGDAVVKVVRLGEERHAMERGSVQVGESVSVWRRAVSNERLSAIRRRRPR